MLRTFGLALLSSETESPLQLAAWYQTTGISFTVDSIAPFLLLHVSRAAQAVSTTASG
jgi:hypothetical protein